MRRLAVYLAIAVGLFAQAPKEGARESLAEKADEAGNKAHAAEEEGSMDIWKWANFLILAGGLGYLVGKNAGPFFAARSAGIRKDMENSLAQQKDAEARAADVDRRLANMEADIAALRGEGERAARAEAERMEQHTAAEIAKIQQHSEQEIASAGKAARMDLKRYAAELAVELAEQKVRARMTPETQDALVQGFVRNLK
uniref:ATP synthase subunit b n=1 Tax=Solibacter usitatus (strain Ellin6076) TaxID=234267 RepID=ATPF_SOLUE|nr:RecName: Full=ATP synthase subunit b; AltName: Full=ATP synthase F(0) sector subunit b; AltName: Full=ATPase subunit I; AltName: Full=F-type ATPase subunit b; Short=F-ATPase subunit b [Candidatus Solibacter usitatus Ellin6076]